MKSLARFGVGVFLFMNCCVMAMDIESTFFERIESQCGGRKESKMTLEDYLKHKTEEYKKYQLLKKGGIKVIEKHLEQRNQSGNVNIRQESSGNTSTKAKL